MQTRGLRSVMQAWVPSVNAGKRVSFRRRSWLGLLLAVVALVGLSGARRACGRGPVLFEGANTEKLPFLKTTSPW